MTVAVLEKQLYDVLNAVVLKKMADISAISEATARDDEDVKTAMETLGERSLVVMVGESAMPTDEAVAALVTAAAKHYDEVRQDTVIAQVADKFEAVNQRFLEAMSAWQQVDVGGRKVANDHQDSSYDAKIIDKMDKLVSRLNRQLEVLAERDPRFGTYSTRFDRAMCLVEGGEIDYVSSPTLDSLHNIWFEFHEDLLRTLGRARKE
ncbi:hypothetical protein GCM10009676_20160 [Prauserella halophila]|uniref:Uncharacterized protein n=1 Tax=Prauserella halophila TaxID=185641 RepID=A0ABP4GRZ7_9PSEU|nr:hypothetical protein [Prauserella halophila]MCP2235789.1 hypothetical protein [Prauserella halophila]